MLIYWYDSLRKISGEVSERLLYIHLNYSCLMSAYLKGQSAKSLFILLASFGAMWPLRLHSQSLHTVSWINIPYIQLIFLNFNTIQSSQHLFAWTTYKTSQPQKRQCTINAFKNWKQLDKSLSPPTSPSFGYSIFQHLSIHSLWDVSAQLCWTM